MLVDLLPHSNLYIVNGYFEESTKYMDQFKPSRAWWKIKIKLEGKDKLLKVSLRFQIYLRPIISYIVCKPSRYTTSPSIRHWKTIGRVLEYLKGTLELGLFYGNYSTIL
ncbi:Uncharacterized protein TCM_027559 [Theobroma cacao]|uniref:Uncharacterized protein n=1 Tax=Theobroma cacao TaxID=3641 RepID=A0A061G9C0_THECC|nr:Uncharacterized protein TCM_027559 [Theobroma cacao]